MVEFDRGRHFCFLGRVRRGCAVGWAEHYNTLVQNTRRQAPPVKETYVTVLKKLFGGLNMSWLFVVVFALVVGVYSGVVGALPATDGTSFHDIAVSQEAWVIFAFIIVTNCKKSWEAALKVFAFFLISQPVFYLVDVAMGGISAEFALQCYVNIWGPATLLTLPGGFIAYFIQKQNPLGWVILGMGCALQALLGMAYVVMMLRNPPFHLLTVLLCFGSIFAFTFGIQRDKRGRIATLAICAGVILLVLVGLKLTGRVLIGAGF